MASRGAGTGRSSTRASTIEYADELHGARRIGYVPAGVVAQTWRGSARQHATVLTSDPDNLTALDPTRTLVTV